MSFLRLQRRCYIMQVLYPRRTCPHSSWLYGRLPTSNLPIRHSDRIIFLVFWISPIQNPSEKIHGVSKILKKNNVIKRQSLFWSFCATIPLKVGKVWQQLWRESELVRNGWIIRKKGCGGKPVGFGGNRNGKIICPAFVFWKKMMSEMWALKHKNSAVCVRTRTVNVNTFSTTVKDEISEGW